MYIITIVYEQVRLCMYVHEFAQVSSLSSINLGPSNIVKLDDCCLKNPCL